MKAAIIQNCETLKSDLQKLLQDCGVSSDVLSHREASSALDDQYDLYVLSGGTLDFRKPEFDGEKSLVLETRKPVFGICMGFQLICKVFGVDLILLPEKYEGEHLINVKGLGELGMEFPDGNMKVRENHRCAIPVCPEGFQVYGTSPYCIEIIVHNSRPIWATQFHPEYPEANEGRQVLIRFLEMVKGGARTQLVA